MKGGCAEGIEHLMHAVAVCGQPQQPLQVSEQSPPPPVFQMLLTKLLPVHEGIGSAWSLAGDAVECARYQHDKMSVKRLPKILNLEAEQLWE